MVQAVPGGRRLFSTLQEAFHHPADSGQLKFRPNVHDFLDNFCWLARNLQMLLTRIAKITPDVLATICASNVTIPTWTKLWISIFFLWQVEFPALVQKELVSYNHHHGTISNSNLEVSRIIENQNILAHIMDICKRTTHQMHNSI